MPGRDIVSIGASAGGINALIDFFRPLPPAEAATAAAAPNDWWNHGRGRARVKRIDDDGG
jgi:hypothetical protein